MGLFDFLKKKKEEPKEEVKKIKDRETVKGTGMQFHLDNIMSFAEENPNYKLTKKELIKKGLIDKSVYEYIFNVGNFTFEEEPTNEYDKNAVKILADGKLVAYVKKGSCPHIKKLIATDNIKEINGKIFGGKYKQIYDNAGYDEKPEYYIENEDTPISIWLEVIYKTPKEMIGG